MGGLNKVLLIGNLGAAPEMRPVQSGPPIVTFSLAVNRRFRGADGTVKEETEWIRVVAWGKTAESCHQFLAKGQQVYVEGRLHTHSWDDKEGQRHDRSEVIATQVLFLSPAQRSPKWGRESAPTTGDAPDAFDLPF
jgi:single-strand DNA-binding protein